jgi:uncharacterized protein YcfJ
MGTPEQRCWVEQRPTGQAQIAGHDVNVPGAVIGGVLGGILGHQIGGGTGNTLATIGGVAGGAALGSNVGNRVAGTQNIRRCENTASGTPQYWDVTYDWRGAEHHVQMDSPPGRTILVNSRGEPRL